tara:strand:- start:23 stop:1258 length:1236 start_codon:yes stop_codon:yes gene_type:complete
MEEKIEVNVVEPKEQASAQEQEAAVLEKAVESGEVDSNYGFQDDGVYRVNVDSPPKQEEENANKEQSADEVSVRNEPETSKKVSEQNEQEKTEEPAQETEKETLELIEQVVEEQPEKEVVQETVQETIQQKDQPEKEIEYPEDIQKLISFMEETNGTLEDYVNLNKDYSNSKPTDLVYEYYRKTKPHLDESDISFMVQNKFGYDEEVAEDQEIKAKQLAFKEEVYNAQKYFESSKKEYYADLKLRKQNDIPEEYEKAFEYYKQQQSEKDDWTKQQEVFLEKTEKVFNDDFKGFDFQVEDKKFRFKIDNKQKVKEYQSDLKNFINEFVNEDGTLGDASSYHKALFAGRNADKIASHFYEQGRADAIKSQVKESKNIDMSPRTDNSVITTDSGDKIRVVSGNSSDKLRIKWNK